MLQAFLEKGDFVGIVTQAFLHIQCTSQLKKYTTYFWGEPSAGTQLITDMMMMSRLMNLNLIDL